MKIPNEINVDGIIFKIVILNSNEPLGKKLVGKVDWQKQCIYIDGNYPVNQQFKTLLHEIIHLIDYDYSLDFSEETIERVSSGLYQVLKNNNLLKE